MSKSMQEKRDAQRVCFTSRILIRTAEGDVDATADSRDISIKGIYVRTENILPAGTHCRLSISLSGFSSEMHLDVAGIVRRNDTTGMGISFSDLEVDSFVHLKNLVQLHSTLAGKDE